MKAKVLPDFKHEKWESISDLLSPIALVHHDPSVSFFSRTSYLTSFDFTGIHMMDVTMLSHEVVSRNVRGIIIIFGSSTSIIVSQVVSW